MVEIHIESTHQLDNDWPKSLNSVINEKSRVVATFDLSEARCFSEVSLITYGQYRKFRLSHIRTVKLKAEEF